MVKAIDFSNKVRKGLDKNWYEEMESINLHKIFYPIFLTNQTIEVCNTIVCYIILAYDNNSNWINLNADRLEDKHKILLGLNADINDAVYSDVINMRIVEIQDVIVDYLISITNWKWRTILSCFDFHAINIKIATEPTTSIDELDKAKINKAKGELLKEAIRQREVGENLLKEIKAEYVKTDRATNQDFHFEVTDEKRIDPLSWREYIKGLNDKGSKVY